MRDKMKTLGLRLTEMSTYLGCSRPTLYKYLNDYENKRYKDIEFKAKNVFDFISKKKTVSKIEVINYIIELTEGKARTEYDELISLISNNKKIEEFINNNGVNETYIIIKGAFDKKGEGTDDWKIFND